MTVTLEAAGTHLHPGARGVVRDGPPSAAPCLILFTDGAMAGASLSPCDDAGWLLAVDGYVTGRGTVVAAKRWLVAFDDRSGTPTYRVRTRLHAA